MTWQPWEAELQDTLQAERMHHRKRRQCWIKGCKGEGAQRIPSWRAAGSVRHHWYCAEHASLVEAHNRVIARILRIPARR